MLRRFHNLWPHHTASTPQPSLEHLLRGGRGGDGGCAHSLGTLAWCCPAGHCHQQGITEQKRGQLAAPPCPEVPWAGELSQAAWGISAPGLSAPGRLGAAWGWGRGDFPVSRGGFAGGRVGGGRSCSGSSSSSASFPAAVNCLVPAVQRCCRSSRPTEAVASSLEGLGGAVSSQHHGASRRCGAAAVQG